MTKALIIVTFLSGAAFATTVQSVIGGVVTKAYPKTNAAVVDIRNKAATALCAESVAAEGIGTEDCSATNVCVVSIQYCDAQGNALDDVAISAKFSYRVEATLQ